MMMIKIYNRKTGDYDVEKVAGEGILKALYGTAAGKLSLELLVKRKLYSALSGAFCDSRLSAGKIEEFAKSFSIDMAECSSDIKDFKTFNEFFARRLKPEARPFNSSPQLLLSPGDGRLKAWANVSADKLLEVKGASYSLKELIKDEKKAKEYDGGTYLILRLCPTDYHRFHFIDGGKCSESKRIKGAYYSVNPIALDSIPLAFCMNKREYSILESDNFGDILYIEVGATSVGSIIQTYTPGKRTERGAEKGHFKFGGSTVLILFKKGTVCIDSEILEQTKAGYETKVLAGEAIGRKFI
jgi:phosphatidylserine decarboxylase